MATLQPGKKKKSAHVILFTHEDIEAPPKRDQINLDHIPQVEYVT